MTIMCDTGDRWGLQQTEIALLLLCVMELCWIIPAMLSYLGDRLQWTLDVIDRPGRTLSAEEKDQLDADFRPFFRYYPILVCLISCSAVLLVLCLPIMACIVIGRTLGHDLCCFLRALENLVFPVPVWVPVIIILLMAIMMWHSKPLLRYLQRHHDVKGRKRKKKSCPSLKGPAAKLPNFLKKFESLVIAGLKKKKTKRVHSFLKGSTAKLGTFFKKLINDP